MFCMQWTTTYLTKLNDRNCRQYINQGDQFFAALFVRAKCVDDLWQDKLVVLPEKAMEDHVEQELHSEGLDEEEPMTENESSNESVYSGPTHDDVRRPILGAFKNHEQRRL